MVNLSDLQKRLIFGFLLTILFLGVFWLGGLACLSVSLLLGFGLYNEWLSLFHFNKMKQFLTSLALLISPLVLLRYGIEWALIISGFIFCAFWEIERKRAGSLLRRFPKALGYLYFTPFVLSLVWLLGNVSLSVIFWVIALVAVNDIAAYFSGRLLGGPKLAPKISPKKTWSGAVGGVLGAGLVGYFLGQLLEISLPCLFLLGCLIACFGSLGDLLESFVKRKLNVKDSSHLIPGHGGLLDRLDGYLVVLPCFALFFSLFFK